MIAVLFLGLVVAVVIAVMACGVFPGLVASPSPLSFSFLRIFGGSPPPRTSTVCWADHNEEGFLSYPCVH